MLIKSRGIVLRNYKYGETSLILDIYTEHHGLRKYIIGGVRSSKARNKANLLQPMSLIETVAYEREDRDMHRLKEIRPAVVYRQIPFDLRRGAVGLFITEVTRKAIREREANAPLFHWLFHCYQWLDATTDSVANYPLLFLLDLSRLLGFSPAGDYSDHTPFFDLREGQFIHHTPGHTQYLDEANSEKLHELIGLGVEAAATVRVSREQRQRLLAQLLDYYRIHLEGFGEVQAHLILREVMDG